MEAAADSDGPDMEAAVDGEEPELSTAADNEEPEMLAASSHTTFGFFFLAFFKFLGKTNIWLRSVMGL